MLVSAHLSGALIVISKEVEDFVRNSGKDAPERLALLELAIRISVRALVPQTRPHDTLFPKNERHVFCWYVIASCFVLELVPTARLVCDF